MFRYNSRSHMHTLLLVHGEKKKNYNIAFSVIALTQIHKEPHQLSASFKQKVAGESDHIYQSISGTVRLALVHVTRLYCKKIQKGTINVTADFNRQSHTGNKIIFMKQTTECARLKRLYKSCQGEERLNLAL